jgi:very-short-patch-repair endonuclease
MSNKCAAVDAKIAGVAEQQHGVITTRQLVGIGLRRDAISRRAARGRLHRVHQGVYAVGHRALSQEGRWMAAVLACGDGAVLSHGSAAALWGLLRPFNGPIDVSVPTSGGRRRRAGIRIHRCATLGADVAPLLGYERQKRHDALVTVRDRIPVTTVQRTIEDLRGAVPPYLVRRATRQAELAGHRLEGIERDRTRSDLELAFIAFCRRFGLPRPEVNARVGGREVDFLWSAERVVAETDDFRYHRGSVAFEDDHARDVELRRRGLAVRRFTGRQLDEEPERVAADLGVALRSAGRSRRSSKSR